MIVIGLGPRMKTHTVLALEAATGARPGERSVTCDREGYDGLLTRAGGLGPERSFAIEDCRHVSGRLERYVLSSGEAVVRVPCRAS